jgi:hypothetical protein
MVGKIFGISLLILFVCGCKTQSQTDNTLRFLQEGKARGHLVVTSQGQVAAGQKLEFYAGAGHATVSFDGDIDFADRVRHISGMPVNTNGE